MAINNVVTKTISDVAFGIVESGGGLIPLGEEIGEWVADPLDYNKIPVVGSIGKDLGESYANVYTEGANVENVLRAVAVTAEAVGTAFGAVKTPKAKAKQPAHKVSRSQYPNHTKMLENAQTQGHSLQNLKRGQGTRAAKKNRYQSQKDIRKRQGGPTDGYDYDEFPYASTEQGGAGAYVEPVPSAENQAAGRDLGIFYREQNVTYGDEFDVEITD
ncbi:MAG: hypothetical protein GY801_45300 [bacterium]|nr:hypothetical protein [bacterium]